MSHVTFETAKRLEAAGFPQPEKLRGGFWYNPDGVDTVFTFDIRHGAAPTMWRYFSPPATDILKELGRDYNLSFMEGFWYCQYSSGDFPPFAKEPSVWKHESPAECAAMAWLQIHEKK